MVISGADLWALIKCFVNDFCNYYDKMALASAF